MGLLDDLMPQPKPQGGLLDDLMPASKPQPSGGLLDDLMPSQSSARAGGSASLTSRPGLQEGRSYDARGMQFKVQGGQLVDQTPQRREFFQERPEMLQEKKPGFDLQLPAGLAQLPKGRQVTGQEAARAEGLTGGYVRNENTYNPTDPDFLSRASQRFITPFLQTARDFAQGQGLKDVNAPNLLNPEDLQDLGAPQGEGRFATFREFAGLQERAPYAQGEVMDAPTDPGDRARREAVVLAAEMVNPADPLNILMEVGLGGAPLIAKGGRALGDLLSVGDDAAEAFARGLSEGAQDVGRAAPLPKPDPIGYVPEPPRAVPTDVSRGAIDNLLGAAAQSPFGRAVGQFGRRLGEEAGLLRQAIPEAAASQEARVGGVNIVEPPPPPAVPTPRADLPEVAPGTDLAVPQRFDPLAILPEGMPQRELTVPASSLDQIDEMLRPRQTEFRPPEEIRPTEAPLPETAPPVTPEPPAPRAEASSIFTRAKAPNNVPYVVERNGRPVRQWLKLNAKEKKAWGKMTPEQRAEMLAPKLEQSGGRFFEPPQRPPAPEAPAFTAERPMALPQQGELLKPPALNPDRPLSVPKVEFRDPLPSKPPGILDDLLPDRPPEIPAAAAIDEVAAVADEVPVPAGASGPGGVRLSAFGAAELQDAVRALDRLPGQLYQGMKKLGDRALTTIERTEAGRKVLRSWRHYMKPYGNAPEELAQAFEQMADNLGVVSQEIADDLVPMLTGDQRGNFMTRLAPNGKWTVLEQQAVGDVIKGDAPRVPLPKGGEEAALMAKETMLRDGLDLLSQTLAVDRAVMGELVQDEILELGKLIRGQAPLSEAPAKLQALAQKSIRDLEKMGALGPADANGVRAIKDNLLHERTFFRRAGRYMPRMYNKFEWSQLQKETIEELVALAPPDLSNQLRETLVEAMQPVAHANRGIQANKMKTIIRDRFLRRRDLPGPLRQALGEILEPALPIAKGHYQLRQAVEMQKAQRFIAQNPAWVRPEGEQLFVDLATKREYVRMATDTPEFGVLQGRLVHPDVADLLETHRLQGSAGEQFYDQLVAAWKYNKVVLNPASHGRNIMSNIIMADIAGMGLDFKAHAQAAAEYLSRTGAYVEARSAGVLGGTFHENEIRFLADKMLAPSASDKPTNWILRLPEYGKLAGRAMGELAQAEDALFKFSLYRHMRKQGMSIEDAAQYVKDWMPNYRQNGRLVQIWAGKSTAHGRSSKVEKALNVAGKFFANPFINFTASALPKAAKTALGIGMRKGEMRAFDPMIALRFWKYPVMTAGVTAASAKFLGMTSAEVEASKPDYMRSAIPGNYMLMPWRDEHGRMQQLDLSYILPWGDFTKMRFNQDDPSPPPTLSAGGPVVPFLEALTFNKNLFTGKEVWSPGMTEEQKNARIIDHIYRGLMPSLAPGIPGLTGSEASLEAAMDPQEWKYALSRSGGSSSSKLFSTIFQIPDYKGRQRALATTLVDVFVGLRLQPVDPAATVRSKAFERVQVIRGIDEEIRRARKDQGWAAAPEVRERYIQGLRERRANILSGNQVPKNPLLQDLWDSILQPEQPGIQPAEQGPIT